MYIHEVQPKDISLGHRRFVLTELWPLKSDFLRLLTFSHLSQPDSAKSSSTTRSRTLSIVSALLSRARCIHPLRRAIVVTPNHATAVKTPTKDPTSTWFTV